jgi:hypothetical protein
MQSYVIKQLRQKLLIILPPQDGSNTITKDALAVQNKDITQNSVVRFFVFDDTSKAFFDCVCYEIPRHFFTLLTHYVTTCTLSQHSMFIN